jgi:hypothetical protein
MINWSDCQIDKLIGSVSHLTDTDTETICISYDILRWNTETVLAVLAVSAFQHFRAILRN